MRLHWMLATLCGLVAVPLVAATTYGAGGDSPAQNDAIARHFDYYDELDLKRYESLEAEFGGSSRVFSSVNTVRFGQLEVRAKLVVPRSDAVVPSGFSKSATRRQFASCWTMHWSLAERAARLSS